MKNKALNGFYENLLADVGVVDSGEGLLSWVTDGEKTSPITIGGKRLALPLRENLRRDAGELTMFHPASEQLMSGPSPVLDALREYIMLRLATTGSHIAKAAIDVALDNKAQKKARGLGNQMLRDLTSADKKMRETLDKVLDNVGLTPETRMYNIFLVASGSKEKPRGLRTSKVSYPILDDAFDDDPNEFFKVKMPRKTKDKPCITQLLFTILDVKDDESNPIKEYTSELRQAPYFHSLLSAFYDIAKHQNKLIDGLSKAAPDLEGLKYNLNWEEEFEDFENFVKKVGHAVPLLPGNKGKALNDDEVEEDEETPRKASTSSWRDIRSSIEEDRDERRREPEPEIKVGKTGSWRDLFKSSQSESRGVEFGRGRDRHRGGFDGYADRHDDEYYSRRGGRYDDRDYRRSRPRDQSPRGWRDIAGGRYNR